MRRVGDNPVTSTNVDELMRRAIEATRSTWPHPNPRVGAVLTTAEGAIVSVAAHCTPGEPHAEVLAIGAASAAGHSVAGSTLFVTLEPCNHHGRTPPCTEAIIEAGVVRVIVGVTDPDERVSGTGIERLRDAAIDVTVGVLEDEVVANDRGYFHHRRTGLPLVTLKLAATLDGQSGAADGTSKWITSREARDDAHRLRAENDVVIVGVGTVIADDPALDVRLEGFDGRQPRPVIISGRRPIPSDRRILERDPLIYPAEGTSAVDPVAVIQDLGNRGVVAAMIEGGPTVASSFLQAGLVDEVVWYTGAKLAGGRGTPAIAGVFETMADISDINITGLERVGPDIKITATLNKEA